MSSLFRPERLEQSAAVERFEPLEQNLCKVRDMPNITRQKMAVGPRYRLVQSFQRSRSNLALNP